LLPRIHQEGIENFLGINLRTYLELFLLKSIRVFLPYAPVAKTKRNIISIAKANKQNKTKLELPTTCGTGQEESPLPLYDCVCPGKASHKCPY